MRYLAVMLLFAASVCWASDKQSTTEHFSMRATVAAVVPLQQFTGTMVTAHFDPRFALTLRVESIRPPLTNFPAGSLATFGIHSPTQLFAGDAPRGKTLDFVLSREIRGAIKGPVTLEVRRPLGQP